MVSLKAVGLAALVTAALPAAVYAGLAVTTTDVNVRAGPSQDYPVVARVMRGVTISVEGCLSNYTWCDVTVGPNRGWVYASNLVSTYQGSSVPVLTYGSALGIGVVSFAVGNYWDSYYRGRPWYPQRQLWINRWGPGGYPPHGGGYRPPPPPPRGGGYRPPPPPHAGGHRPPPPPPRAGGNRPPPPGAGGHRPPPPPHAGGNRPPPSPGAGGHRPPQQGGGGNRPQQDMRR